MTLKICSFLTCHTAWCLYVWHTKLGLILCKTAVSVRPIVHSEGDKWWRGEKKAEVFGELRSQYHSVHRQSHTGWGEKPENVAWYLDTGVTLPAAEIHSYVLYRDTDFHVETAWSPYFAPLCSLTPCYVTAIIDPPLSVQGLLGGYGRGIDRQLLNEVTAVIFKCRSLFSREFCTWNLK